MDIRLRSWGGVAGLLVLLGGCNGVVNNDDLVLALTDRISVAVGNVQADNDSKNARISGDGRFVVFQSKATNLALPAPTNGKYNVYVLDRSDGSVVRVSVAFAGGDPDFDCVNPVVTDNGRYVAFETQSTNLINGGDGNGFVDVYVWDRQGAVISVVSGDSATNAPVGGSSPSITPDGTLVAFESAAPAQLIDPAAPVDGGGLTDIFVRDVVAGTTVAVTINGAATGMGNGASVRASISEIGVNGPGGYFVAFESAAKDLDGANPPGPRVNIFRRAMPGGAALRLSLNSVGGAADLDSNFASISRNGLFVAFASDATNLVVPDVNGQTDIFVRDVLGASTTLVSVHSSGTQGAGASLSPRISADGAFVAFQSSAPNLVDDDTNLADDIFLHQVATGSTIRVSVKSYGDQTPALSITEMGDLSGDGKWVVFNSNAGNLVSGDSNGVHDVFIRGKLR